MASNLSSSESGRTGKVGPKCPTPTVQAGQIKDPRPSVGLIQSPQLPEQSVVSESEALCVASLPQHQKHTPTWRRKKGRASRPSLADEHQVPTRNWDNHTRMAPFLPLPRCGNWDKEWWNPSCRNSGFEWQLAPILVSATV